jgi:hypothetical protein
MKNKGVHLMSTDGLSNPEQAWGELYDGIRGVLQGFGIENPYGKEDYLVVDDNFGWFRHTVEIHKLKMLQPGIVAKLRALLERYPNWEIVIAVDIPGTERIWPRMA